MNASHPTESRAPSPPAVPSSLRAIELIACGLAGAALLVPLVLSPKFLFPFIAPKVFVFRGLAALLAAAHVVLWAACPGRYWPGRSPLNLAVALFLASFALSSILGVDLHRSLWDTQERMLGLVTVLHYGAFYYALVGIMRDRGRWDRLLAVFFLSGAAVVTLGLVQKLDPSFLYNQEPTRVPSTLGHPSYLGGFGLFLTFAAGLWRNRDGTVAWRLARAGAALVGITAIAISDTRGSFLGLGAGGLVILAWHAVTLKDRPRRRRIFVALLLAAVTLAAAAAFLRDAEPFSRIPGLRRFSQFSLEDGSIRTRILAWDIALKAWRERPITGWGPGNYYHVFNRHYDPEYLQFGREETWVDNAHNVVLNTLTVQGALGLCAYLALIAAGVAAAIRGWRSGRMDSHAAGCAVALLVAHLVHNLFVFENPTSYLALFFLLAFLSSASSAAEPAEQRPVRLRAWVVLSTGVLALLAAVWLNAFPARANFLWRKSIGVLEGAKETAEAIRRGLAASPGIKDPQSFARDLAAGRIIPTAAMRELTLALDEIRSRAAAAAVLYRRAASCGSPHRDGASEALAEQVLRMGPGFSGLGWMDPLVPLCELAHDEVKRAVEIHPLDVRQRIRMVNLAVLLFAASAERSRLEEAEALLAAHLHLSPRRQEIYFQLAVANAALGRGEKAIQYHERVIELAPEQSNGYVRLADLLARGRQPAKAREVLDRMRRAGVEPGWFQQKELEEVERRIAEAEAMHPGAEPSRK